MRKSKSNVQILRKKKDLGNEAKTGVSLHCHTEESREMLDFVPHYCLKIPVISYFWKEARKKYIAREGRDIDFSTGFWIPPMTPHQVFELEKEQINNAGLDAVVSLTDHDSIDGNLKVNKLHDAKFAPISMEWTVPFECAYFHVGVHNLPPARAEELTRILLDYTFDTARHSNENLAEMFSMLNEIPEVLVVLNHPIWDIELIGKQRHAILLSHFLQEHGKWIHALEVNGFRAWDENKKVIEMAEALGFPLVTGGDRHGCKPNTVINLTNSATFDEFAHEIRVDKRSEVVLMPEYRYPLQSRQLQSFSEILRSYPEFEEGRQRWIDRIHFDVGDGFGLRPLSAHWGDGGPTWVRWAVRTLGIFGSPAMRPLFRLIQEKKDRVPRGFDKVQIAAYELPAIIGTEAGDSAPTKTEFAS